MNEDLGKQLSDILADKNIDLNQILDNFKNSSQEKNTQKENKENENGFSGQIDTDTFLKFQKIFNLINSKKDNRTGRKFIKSLKTIYERF